MAETKEVDEMRESAIEGERDENDTLTTTFLIKEQPPWCAVAAAAKGVSLRSVADNNNKVV